MGLDYINAKMVEFNDCNFLIYRLLRASVKILYNLIYKL